MLAIGTRDKIQYTVDTQVACVPLIKCGITFNKGLAINTSRVIRFN